MKKFLLTAPLLLLLSGCASYRAQPLNNTAVIQTEAKAANTIAISAKAFDIYDCKKYLDRDVLRQGYQPVQLIIQNNTDKSYQFSLDRLGITCARPEEVALKVHTSTVGRSVAYGVGALVIWPLAIPAIIDGVKSSNANEALDTDFRAKAAGDSMIYPGSTFNKILFVPRSQYQSAFPLKLMEIESGDLKEFNILTN